MRHKIMFVLLTCLALMAFPRFVSAADNAQASQKWICVKGEIYKGADNVGGKTDHLVQIKAAGLPAKAEYQDGLYLIGCISTADNYKCTTGNADLDTKLGLSKEADHEFNANGDNPFTATGGSLDRVIRSATKAGRGHAFFVVAVNPTENVAGSSVAQKQGTFVWGPDLEKCVSMLWDPYGTVFDSQSLEPLPNANITLLDDVKQPARQIGLVNPYPPTAADGQYFFMVNPGDYYLSVAPYSGYTFSAAPKIHSNYTLAYSDIYQPDSVITETAGKPEHRDIALDPGSNAPYRAEPVLMYYGAIRLGLFTRVEGKVSHPLTIIIVKQNGKELDRQPADRYGMFSIVMSNDKLTPDAPITVDLQKVDLTTNVAEQKTRQALSFFPIPAYVEGYARDAAGTAISYATVQATLDSSGKVVAEVKADNNGYFKMSPQILPIFNYGISYFRVNSQPRKLTIPEFYKENSQYLTSKNVNLMTATVNNTPLVKSPAGSGAAISPGGSRPTQMVYQGSKLGGSPAAVPTVAVSGNSSSNFMLTVIILLALIVGAGLIAGFYLYRKNRSPGI